MSFPFLNLAPARTRATRWGALTARQRACADSMSLHACAIPAAREPGPLVTRCRSRTVAKVDSIAFRVGEHIAQRFPEPQCAVGDGEHRGAHPLRPDGLNRSVLTAVCPKYLGTSA